MSDGELEVSRHHLTPGYYRRPEETAHAFHDGWFRTGDLAEIDDNGYVRIVGARRRLFMSAASTSSRPRSRRPCSPIPTSPTPPSSASRRAHGRGARRLRIAAARRDLNTRDLIAFARSRIAGYKVPYAIEILPELPLLPSGKPDRKALAG